MHYKKLNNKDSKTIEERTENRLGGGKKISSQITDEHEDVKNVSAKISTLIAKVDSLPKTTTPEVTSSIPTRHARNQPSRAGHKRMMVRQRNRSVPVSVGGAVLSVPATMSSPQG